MAIYFDNSNIITGSRGPEGPQGEQGIQGVQGPAGPNEITGETATTLNGLLKGSGGTVSAAMIGTDYASPALLQTATLTAAGWSSKTQTVTVSGVLADATKQAILPGPVISSMEAWVSAGVICSGQGANTLIFSCTSVPTTDITVSIAIFDATT